ncbi:MAG: ABC-type transport auxiliary lipoprotein family protein [Planctomycetota bacterium]|nr:ABC-type transport auxiliary lipoprotein family protein [Planctomycetota bacterium]
MIWLDLALEPLHEPVALREGASPVRLEWEPVEVLLSDRLVVRRGRHQVEFDDGARWIESPTAVVARALEDELYGRRGLAASTAPGTLRVSCSLQRFELDLQDQPQARVRIRATVTRGDASRAVIVAGADAAPAPGGSPADAAAALSEALTAAIDSLASQIEAALVSGS